MTIKPGNHARPIVWEDNPAAPFITFDVIGTSSVVDSAFQLTLSAQRLVIGADGNGVDKRATTVAHLRMTPEAARAMAAAIKSCFDMAEAHAKLKVEGQPLN